MSLSLSAAPTSLSPPATRAYTFPRRTLMHGRADSLWRIEKGVVRSFTWLEDATTVTLGVWGPGDVLGKVLSTADPYQLETLTPVEATLLPPAIWQKETAALIAHSQRLQELTVIRSSRRVEDALAQLLVWLGKRFGQVVAQGHLIDLRLTHQDLAELIGTTRVTTTRVINQLEQQGMIQRLTRHQIVLQIGDQWHYEI